MPPPCLLSGWTWKALHEECRREFNRYSRELDAHYESYFRDHPDERGAHPRQAVDLEHALPPGWDHLSDEMGYRLDAP